MLYVIYNKYEIYLNIFTEMSVGEPIVKNWFYMKLC